MSAGRTRLGSTVSTTEDDASADSTASGDFDPVDTRTKPVAPATSSTEPPADATAFSTELADALSLNRTSSPSVGPSTGVTLAAARGLAGAAAFAGPASVIADRTASASPEPRRRRAVRPDPDGSMRFATRMTVRSGYRTPPLNR